MIDAIVAGLTAGSRISHFEVLQKLGEGGMGVVYKARDLRLDRLVALKVLSEHAASDPVRQARLVQEAKAASSLNHPHIVTVHEIDTVEGMTFIAMEHIEGRPLDQLIPQRGLRYTEVLKYAVQIAEGLAAAHAIGIIHRDVKPANIMVSSSGVVKVLDFGLAKHAGYPLPSPGDETVTLAISEPLTRDGAIPGTVAYMSPEQAEGKPLDARSDIFSLGIVLYEMLTGHRPFTGDTVVSTMAAIVNQAPKPVRQLVEGLPAEVERVVSRCLRKDPARRFQDMADLAVALTELKDESDSGTLAPAGPAAGKPKIAWLWGGLGLILGAAVALWYLNRLHQPQPIQTVLPVTNYSGTELHPSVSPDGKQVAFSWDGEKGGNFDIYVKLIGETGALRLTTDPAEESFPAWSPDAKRIAFRRAGEHPGIYSVSPLGGAASRLTDFTSAGQMSWSPDGKWLAISGIPAGEPAGIFLLPMQGGEPQRISTSMGGRGHHHPAFSRTGRQVAFAASGLVVSELFIHELDPEFRPRGAARRIADQLDQVNGLAWSQDDQSLVFSTGFWTNVEAMWRLQLSARKAPERLDLAGSRVSYPSIPPTGSRLVFSRSMADQDLVRYSEEDGVRPFIPSTANEHYPHFAPDGKMIAFESNRSGVEEVWLAQADGSNPIQLTSGLGRHQGTPRWSPDGRQIAFDSLGSDGQWDIYAIDSSGGRPRRITSEPTNETTPSWSRDGKWIYFNSNRTGRSEIWRAPAAGGVQERVTDNGGSSAFESADGKNLFYLKPGPGRTPLIARSLAGGPERQLLPEASRAFQPTRNGIYYLLGPDLNRGETLQFHDFSTGKSRVLTRVENTFPWGLAVSPDGKTVVFTAASKSGADLMMIENFRD